MQACKNLRIPFTILEEHGNFLKLEMHGKVLFFVNFNVPWNNSGTEKIARDKGYSYQLFHEQVRMPKSIAYFDPRYTDAKYEVYRKFKNIPEIVRDMCTQFAFPFVIKMNGGSRARNMFICHDTQKVTRALRCIFNKKSRYYDYAATAQELIDIADEYRVIMFRGEIMLAYKKNPARVTKIKSNAKAEIVIDKKLLADLQNFVRPIYDLSSIEYTALDVAMTKQGELCLFELNVAPGFDYFVRHNGEQPLVEMFERILEIDKESPTH